MAYADDKTYKIGPIMKKIKQLLLALAVMTMISLPTYASSSGMDLALTYSRTIEDDSGQSVTNPYPFSAILLPYYEKGNFSIELRLPFSFNINDESQLVFDTSVFEPVEKDDDSDFEYIMSNISHYLTFISYIQFGYDWEDFNFRFGKISNSTIGNGALIYHYRDDSITSYDTRPGLKFKLDGKYLGLGFMGLEGITNDLTDPDFYGGRFYVKPMYYSDKTFFQNTEFGFTAITYNATDGNDSSSTTAYNSVAFDITQPLLDESSYSMFLYYDLINEKNFDSDSSSDDYFVAEDGRSISLRLGLDGRYFTKFSYNAYLQSYLSTDADDTDANYVSEVGQLLTEALIPSFNGDFKFYGETGYYTTNGDSYAIIDSTVNFEDSELESFTVGASFKSYTPVLIFNELKVTVEKTYEIDDSSNEMEESFVTGLTSGKNVAFTIQSDIQYGINMFDVGLSLETDNEGTLEYSYKFGFRISLF